MFTLKQRCWILPKWVAYRRHVFIYAYFTHRGDTKRSSVGEQTSSRLSLDSSLHLKHPERVCTKATRSRPGWLVFNTLSQRRALKYLVIPYHTTPLQRHPYKHVRMFVHLVSQTISRSHKQLFLPTPSLPPPITPVTPHPPSRLSPASDPTPLFPAASHNTHTLISSLAMVGEENPARPMNK